MARSTESTPLARLLAPRRAALRVLAATGLGLVALSGKGPDSAAKNKKHKKKCRKRKKHDKVTCAEVCSGADRYAFHLFEGGDICAASANAGDCYECTTTSECVGHFSVSYACVRDFTNFTTGTTSDFSGLCGPYTRGICASFEPCVLA